MIREKSDAKKILRADIVISLNGVVMIATEYLATDWRGTELLHWSMENADSDSIEYIDSMDNSIGKMYSLWFREVSSFDEYLKIWKNRHITHCMSACGKTEYMLNNLYCECDITQDDFNETMNAAKFILDEGFFVHYNDDHGVGEFKKIGNKYKMRHCRYGAERIEKGTFEDIVEFVRAFFRIGYSLNKDW